MFETYSKRQKRLERGGTPDVYQYETLPQPFRVQVVHTWNSAIGLYYRDGYSTPASGLWDAIFSTICREHGVFSLGDSFEPHDKQCKQFVLAANVSPALDIIELSFRVIDQISRRFDVQQKAMAKITQSADDAIEDLNHRFQEHGIGYQYLNGELVRIDSQFLHVEAVKPALSLLNQPGFEGPAEEFMRAFEHYRHNRGKEAVAEALKSFESTMKAICRIRSWGYAPNATAKPLLDTLFKNGLIPPKLENHFAGLRGALESGLPTISNPNRHGQGPEPSEITQHMVAFALHLTSSNIVFLVRAHIAMK